MLPLDASGNRRVIANKIQAYDVARSNTLDFASKVVCHETVGFFGFFRRVSDLVVVVEGFAVNSDGKRNFKKINLTQLEQSEGQRFGALA